MYDEGVFCVSEWLSLRGYNEETQTVTLRAEVDDSSNDNDKTSDG